ncbi:uncharacterized protein LOC131225936 [Magnolia sinica]|uniref:uncharacterized protein LOC131225936 n=1 Tax=Magnolia sinica TaxID=86752 RepID=UPI00265A3919|nr:uncharacterized protein LOC131225936 [Magnolia sinica]
MLALDRPFIANVIDSDMQTNAEICLEYGSATQLYLVPFIQHEEQVLVASTPNWCQGSRLLNGLSQSQGPKVSQVALPYNSEGSIDFSNYPFRSFIVDLRDKMTRISLYGAVTNILREGGRERWRRTLLVVEREGCTRLLVVEREGCKRLLVVKREGRTWTSLVAGIEGERGLELSSMERRLQGSARGCWW